MKQTAVEFAVEKLAKFIPSGNQLVIHIILQEAKEIEKQQIIDARQDGYESTYNDSETGVWDKLLLEKSNEQYYNETFKNKIK